MSERIVAVSAMAWGCLLASQGCSPRSCYDLHADIASVYAHCHLDAEGAQGDSTCLEAEREVFECNLSCVEHAGCATLKGEDPAGSQKYRACLEYCGEMFVLDVSKGANQ